MAYVKEFNVHDLRRAIDYVLNPAKTEEQCYTAVLKCKDTHTAHDEMMETKRRFGKLDKVQGHHYIQSFKPGEVTPELAHQIGVELAKRCFADKYEVVIGTHLDKNHYHNHFVLNSVSFVDGRKYQSNVKTLNNIRKISDEICKEHGLSVIQPKGRGKHYAEWKAEHDNKPTIRAQIKADIDEIIAQSYDFDTFLELLRLKGYAIKRGENVKHFAIRPPYSTKFIRLRSLGEGYSDEEIARRIEETIFQIPSRNVRTFYYKGNARNIKPTKRYTGLQALYLRFLYEMGTVRKRQCRPKVTAYMRQELLKFEKFVAERDFIFEHGIKTGEQLEEMLVSTIGQIDEISAKRAELYRERRLIGGAPLEEVKAGIGEYTESLRVLRKQKAMCERIFTNIPALQERLQKIREMEVISDGRRTNGRYGYEDRI